MAPCATLTDGNPTRIRCTTIPDGPHSNTRRNSVHCESSDKNDSSIEGMVTSRSTVNACSQQTEQRSLFMLALRCSSRQSRN